ncbi:MAG: sigma-70 family RNA polymerase sigma factor [Gemmatimonadaceae bacterium]
MLHNSSLQGSVEPTGDACMVARVRDGDQAAFEILFEHHHEGLWRFAYHQAGCAETSREIVQDVFFALWRKHAEWEVTSSISGWLYGAVRHQILRHRRSERTVTRITARAARAVVAEQGARFSDDAIAVAMGAPARDAHALLEDRELDSAVTMALATLTERRRVAMTLRWKHDLPAPEIARVLGTTPQAVRHLLMRAREEIATLLNNTRDE